MPSLPLLWRCGELFIWPARRVALFYGSRAGYRASARGELDQLTGVASRTCGERSLAGGGAIFGRRKHPARSFLSIKVALHWGRNGLGSRFRATIHHKESRFSENDSRPLSPDSTKWR